MSRADDDVSEKYQLEKELEAAREKVITLETKCSLHEKVSSCDYVVSSEKKKKRYWFLYSVS